MDIYFYILICIISTTELLKVDIETYLSLKWTHVQDIGLAISMTSEKGSSKGTLDDTSQYVPPIHLKK